MLDVLGQDLDGGHAARRGLERQLSDKVVSRNLRAFDMAPEPARLRIVGAIDEIARLLDERRAMDLDADAFRSCASLLTDAGQISQTTALSASGRLLPVLMRSRQAPASELLAAAFPMVYRELAAKDDEISDFLKFIPFVDWDRCKSARHELVGAFLSSSWAPGDLALIACRCDELGKLLRRTAKAYGGEAYLERMAQDLSRLPEACRASVERGIMRLRSDRAAKLNGPD